MTAFFLSTPHATDAQMRTMLPHDERRLPTGMMYIYQNVQRSTGPEIRMAVLTKCQVSFTNVSVPNPVVPGRNKTVIQITQGPGTLRTAAEALDKLIEKNWPGSAPTPARRPYALLAIIEKVQADATFAPLRGFVTENAFVYTDQIKQLARTNKGDFRLK